MAINSSMYQLANRNLPDVAGSIQQGVNIGLQRDQNKRAEQQLQMQKQRQAKLIEQQRLDNDYRERNFTANQAQRALDNDYRQNAFNANQQQREVDNNYRSNAFEYKQQQDTLANNRADSKLEMDQEAHDQQMQIRQQVFKTEQEEVTFKSVLRATVGVSTYLQKGDIEGALRYAFRRRAEILATGGDPSDTDEFIHDLQSGNIEKAIHDTDTILAAGERMGYLKPFGKGEQSEMDKAKLREAQAKATIQEDKVKEIENRERKKAGIVLDLRSNTEYMLNPENRSAFNASFGMIDGRRPSFGQDRTDMKVKINHVKDMLTSDNLEMMAGVLSESDVRLLANISSGQLDFKNSEKEAIKAAALINRATGGSSYKEVIYPGMTDNQIYFKRGEELESLGLSDSQIQTQLKREGW